MRNAIRSIEARIKRAEMHIQEMERMAITTISEPLATTCHHDTATNEIVISLATDLPDASPDFNLICGEALYHLRCSLDNLIYALVIEAGNNPTRDNAFPIYLEHSHYEIHSIKKLKGVDKGVADFVRAQQPFGPMTTREILFKDEQLDERFREQLKPRPATPQKFEKFKRHPLWLLSKLNNADKHWFSLRLGINSTLGSITTNDFHISNNGYFVKQSSYRRGSECFRYSARCSDVEWERGRIDLKPTFELFFDNVDGKQVDGAVFPILRGIARYVSSIWNIAKVEFFR